MPPSEVAKELSQQNQKTAAEQNLLNISAHTFKCLQNMHEGSDLRVIGGLHLISFRPVLFGPIG